MVILGSTGSIGKNSLKICDEFKIKVEALSCAKNYEILNSQIEKFKPKFVCIQDKNLKDKVNHDKVFCGDDGILEMIRECQSSLFINALVGFSGLMPSIEIQKNNKILALANKESLVVGGKFLKTNEIRPIDSEHFGLKFLLENKTPLKKLIITASGGAFLNLDTKELENATPKMALKHPNWDMGAKITIDSATMVNKLFEVLEAFWLYNTKNIDALIEKTSTIHALVQFIDGSTTAHLSGIDMKLAIAHAINKNLKTQILEDLDILKLKELKFQEIDLEKFPAFSLKNEILQNPDLGAIINCANEVGVYAFLQNRCKFTDISRLIFKALDKFSHIKINEISQILQINEEINQFCVKELKC